MAQHVHNETCRAIEATVGADVAAVRDNLDIAPCNPDPEDEEDGLVVNLDDPHAMSKLNVYFQTCAILDAVQSANEAEEKNILTKLASLLDSSDGAGDTENKDEEADTDSEWEPGRLEARREAVPVSDYGDKALDKMLAAVFPT